MTLEEYKNKIREYALSRGMDKQGMEWLEEDMQSLTQQTADKIWWGETAYLLLL